MPSVLFKEGSSDAPRLARLYGVGATTGIPIYFERRDGRLYFIALLAEGECDGIEKLYYKGFELPEFAEGGARNWRFHPGTKSTGFADPVQGRPEFFPAYPTCLSEKSYVEVALSRELSEGDDEPTRLKVVMRGVKMYDYTFNAVTGLVEKVGVNKIYSVNPALEFIDIAVEVGGVSLARFHRHGATWLEYKNRCAALINWLGGNVYVPAVYEAAAGIAASGDGAIRKTSATGWTGVKVSTAIPANTKGGFSFRVTTGSVAAGLSTATPASDAAMYAAVGCGDNGQCYLWRQGVSTPLGEWLPSDEWDFRAEAGVLKLFKNGAEVDTTATPLPPATVNLYGSAAFYNINSHIGRSRLLLTSTTRQVPRYTGHFAFAGVDVPTAIAALMIRTFGCDWYDANGGIGFFPSPVRPVAHRFTFDPTQTLVRSNMVRDKFNFTEKDDTQLINFFRWSYRNLDDPLLTIAYDYTDRPALRAAPFFAPLKQSEIVSLGVSNQSEVQRIGEAHARYFTDLGGKSFYVEGQADSYGVTKGSVVEVSHDVTGYRETAPPKYLVTEESFIAGSADDRGFVVVPYNETFYDDAAHGAIAQVVAPPSAGSPFDAPPRVADVVLTEGNRTLPDGTFVPELRAAVTFAESGHAQRARVWWKEPGGAWTPTTQVLTPSAANGASFELAPARAGTHEVKVVTESLAGVTLEFDQHPAFALPVVGILPPAAPRDGAKLVDFEGNALLSWDFHDGPPLRGEDAKNSKLEIVNLAGEVMRGPVMVVTRASEPPTLTFRADLSEGGGVCAARVTLGDEGTISALGSNAGVCVYQSERVRSDYALFEFEVDARLPPVTFAVVGAAAGVTFTADPATDVLTLAPGHEFENGNRVETWSSGVAPAPLNSIKGGFGEYYMRDLVGNTCKLSATPGGAPINITSVGSGGPHHLDPFSTAVVFFIVGQYGGVYYIAPELLDINPATRAPGTARRPMPGDRYAIEVVNRHARYLYMRGGVETAPMYTSAQAPFPKYVALQITLGQLNGEPQAALRTRITTTRRAQFRYTREMQEHDFGAVQDPIRFRVRQVSDLVGDGTPALFVV